MEEQKTTNPDVKKEPKKNAKKEKKSDKPSFSEHLADYKAEFKKIVWPNRNEVAKNTVTVVITSLMIGAILFCMDSIYTTGYSLLVNLIK